MGSAAYKKFFSVDLKHNFYLSGRTADFDLAPASYTSAKMLNQKLVFRNLTNGFTLLYKAVSAADANPFSEISDGVYSFAMILKSPKEFLNITDLTDINSATHKSGNIIYFRNTNPATNTIPKHELLSRLLPAKFSYDFSITNTAVVKLRIRDAAGNEVFLSPALAPDDNGVFHAEADLSKLNPGKYVIQQVNNITIGSPAGTVIATENVYVDSTLFGKNIFGIIDIEFKSSALPFASFVLLNSFQPEFLRRSAKWKYYIVNKSGRETANLPTSNIADTTGTDPIYGSITFSGPTVATPVNGFTTYSFLSASVIPFYEKPKQGLELQRSSGGNIIDDLPNPNRQSSAAESPNIIPVFVFI